MYPTLYRFDPAKKPINFVDDVVVRAERISELICYLEEFFKGQRVPVAIFGHIGNGNAHIVASAWQVPSSHKNQEELVGHRAQLPASVWHSPRR